MNILFFLTPKSDVAYLYDDFTVRQALEKMENQRYSSIPVINRKGEYVATITEGDILWFTKEKYDLKIKDSEDVLISDIKHKLMVRPVSASATIESLILLSMNQNFVPVIDDDNIFIGLVTRKDIIEYCYNQLSKNKLEKE